MKRLLEFIWENIVRVAASLVVVFLIVTMTDRLPSKGYTTFKEPCRVGVRKLWSHYNHYLGEYTQSVPWHCFELKGLVREYRDYLATQRGIWAKMTNLERDKKLFARVLRGRLFRGSSYVYKLSYNPPLDKAVDEFYRAYGDITKAFGYTITQSFVRDQIAKHMKMKCTKRRGMYLPPNVDKCLPKLRKILKETK